MSPKTFIFFGRSGCGKGTQAKLLIDALKQKDKDRRVLYLETGQGFRDFAEKDSLTAKQVKKIMDDGDLIPEFLPIWIWTQFMIDNISGDEHLVLDGLSRREHEAPILDSAMKFYKRENPYVVLIDVSRDWASERLKNRGRADDLEEEDINHRQDWFDNNVMKAINFFKDNSYYNFMVINGEQSIEDVHKEILNKIEIFNPPAGGEKKE